MSASPPVLTSAAALALERARFAGDAAAEWAAMQQAGRAVAAAVRRDFAEVGPWPAAPRVRVLAGKGHNAGDACIAAHALLAAQPAARVEVIFAFGERSLRPLAARAWRELATAGGERVQVRACARNRPARVGDDLPAEAGPCREAAAVLPAGVREAGGAVPGDRASDGAGGPLELLPAVDVLFDGVFGFQFRPPLDDATAALLAAAGAGPARWRVAIDLPSGLGDPRAFRADVTYATGSVKAPVLDPAHVAHVGRLRYLDLGFFPARPVSSARRDGTAEGGVSAAADPSPAAAPLGRMLTPAWLAPLAAARPATGDKRTYGHLLVIGGSRLYAGAILMAVRAALRSGVGLVTAGVPESLTAAFAAAVPEVMWLGWPETPDGSLALEGRHLLRRAGSRATALLLGPGLGREREALALAVDLVREAPWPTVLDADALQPEIVAAAQPPLVLTPHAGEYARLDPAGELAAYARPDRVVIAKGPRTRVSDGAGTYHLAAGGPVLARGGSGDLLAGLAGGLLAQAPADPLLAAGRAALWHALAADALACARGATAVQTTDLLEFLAPALRAAAAGAAEAGS